MVRSFPWAISIAPDDAPPALHSVADLEALAACWLAMAQASTLDEIEEATLNGLHGLIDIEIAYTARRENAVWTISRETGLVGDIAGVAIPEEHVPYADGLRAGRTVCYEDEAEMGSDLAQALRVVGIGAVYAVPIMRGDLCIGALAIGHHGPGIFNARDRALVRLFTAHLSALVVKRELVQALETLAENVPVIVLRTDPTGWINWYNRRWYEFTGQTREEAAGWGWQTAHHPEDFPRVIQEWPRALATGRPIEIEFRLRRYDGVYHWFLARVEPVRDDKGVILSWYGSVIDIEAQKQALERTQRVAETLQEAFIPQQLPQRELLRLDACYISAEQDALVGGDWYDAFELGDGNLVVSIGDVTGHGLVASMAVGKLRQAIYTLATRIADPAEILRELNLILRAQEPDTFVTAIVGFIAADGRSVRYASAGHPPPVVAYAANAPGSILFTGGPPLGVLADLRTSTHTVPVEADTVMLFYTDGLTEYARDAKAAEQKLRTLVASFVGDTTTARPAKRVYDRMLEGAASQDDVAVMMLQFSKIDASETIGAEEIVPAKHWRFHASDAQAAHVARREVGKYLRRIGGATDETFASELIVGELLANTVEHAPGLVDISIEWAGDRSTISVRDSGPGLDTVRTTLPSDPMSEGSRGLFLVHAMSSDVTVVEVPGGGTELRVVLPLKPIASPPRR